MKKLLESHGLTPYVKTVDGSNNNHRKIKSVNFEPDCERKIPFMLEIISIAITSALANTIKSKSYAKSRESKWPNYIQKY